MTMSDSKRQVAFRSDRFSYLPTMPHETFGFPVSDNQIYVFASSVLSSSATNWSVTCAIADNCPKGLLLLQQVLNYFQKEAKGLLLRE